MQRPVLHDKTFAMARDWEQHAEALEAYATWLEGGLDLAKTIVRELSAEVTKLRADSNKPAPASGFGNLGDVMNDIFGPMGGQT